MLKIYLKTVLKAFANNRIYSFVTVFGLTIGLCACMIVATVVIDDLSYDRQWTKSADLYRIISVDKRGEGLYERSSMSFSGLGPELKKNFPDVLSIAAISSQSLRYRLSADQSDGIVMETLEADTSVMNMLDIHVLSGNPRKFTDGVNNLLISESMRDRLFPRKDPIGETIYELSGYGEKPAPYLITGVIKDLPSNTHLRAQAIRLQKPRTDPLYHVAAGSLYPQYLLLRHAVDIRQFTAKVNQWYSKYMGDSKDHQFSFQPVDEVYLHSDFNDSQAVKGTVRNIYIFSGVAILLLLIACINYINLSTARVVSRLQETGVRKILGAARKDIILQFLTESVAYFVISTIIALFLYLAGLHLVEFYLGHNLEQTLISRVSLFAGACAVILFVSVFTGIYPAWLLSGIPASGALKGSVYGKNSQGQSWLRKSLVVIQFAISILVLIGMIVVYQQVGFMQHADIGFDPKGLLSIESVSWDGRANAFKSELRELPAVKISSITSFNPATGATFMTREANDPGHPGNKIKVWYLNGDIDLARTLGLRLRSGRFLNPDLATDVSKDEAMYEKNDQSSLITVSAAKMLQINDLNNLPKDSYSRPVGIVEDFHNESLRKALAPIYIIASRSPQYGGMLIRVIPGKEQEVMKAINRIWKTMYPEKFLEIDRVEDQLIKQYEGESKLAQLLAFFSMLTMILAALGVFGLIVHVAGQRVKEIGIRRVLGASVSSIVRLLSSDFGKLVLFAIIISSPLSWWLMNKWLEDFAYRIQIKWWVFALAGTTALLIALVTISLQAVKSAVASPVKSLRSE